MGIEIQRRPLTPDETDALRKSYRHYQGCLDTLLGPVIPGGGFAILSYFVFGLLAGLLRVLKIAEPPFPDWLKGVFLYVPLIIGLGVGWAYLQSTRRERRKRHEERLQGTVEEGRVKTTRVVQQGGEDGDYILYIFDLGEGQTLLIHGEWLWDCERFGIPWKEDAEADIPFPCTFFSYQVLPDGYPTITPGGDRLKPEFILSDEDFLPSPWREVLSKPGSIQVVAGDFDKLLQQRPS